MTNKQIAVDEMQSTIAFKKLNLRHLKTHQILEVKLKLPSLPKVHVVQCQREKLASG